MNLREAIQEIAKPTGQMYSALAEVISVDEGAMTCDVKLLDSDLEMYDVRLPSCDGQSPLMIPKKGSLVAVSYLDKYNGFVTMVTVAEYINIKNENEDLKLILSDLIDEITRITVQTPVGVSATPVNTMAFTSIKNRLPKLFK